jgi:hypothetical protein
MENDKYIPIRALSQDPAEDSAVLRFPDDPIPKDPRQWPLDENISTPNTDYKGDRNYDGVPDDRADNDPYVPYRGYQGNDNRALQINPASGQMRAAPNQDAGGGNPYMGTTGGWSDFSGRGGGGGSGFTDFSGLT